MNWERVGQKVRKKGRKELMVLLRTSRSERDAYRKIGGILDRQIELDTKGDKYYHILR